MKKIIEILIIFIIIFFVKCTIKDNNELNYGFIKGEDLLQTVKKLCSKEYAGRRPGDETYMKAAKYVVKEFQELGIKSITGEDYFQYLNVPFSEIDTPNAFSLVKDGKVIKEYNLGLDYAYYTYSGTGDVTAPVVYCGYGMHQPEDGYDDYGDVDIKNKIVMIFSKSPNWKKEDVEWNSMCLIKKARIARQNGAKAVIFIRPSASIQALGTVYRGEDEYLEDMPIVYINSKTTNELLLNTGKSLDEIQSINDSLELPYNENLNITMHIQSTVRYFKSKPTVNIIGLLEGSDENLKDEYLYIMAHLDHVGHQCAMKTYFPGANDNASGCAAVINIAKAFVKNVKPKRSVIFALLSAEEMGLIGAKYLAENLPVPVEKTVGAINMDCIAYGDSIKINNSSGSPELYSISKKIDSENYNLLVYNTWKGGGTDAIPLGKKGIPYISFVTSNSYKLIHQAIDVPDSLNIPLFEKTTNLVYRTAVELSRKKNLSITE